jgi:rod shape-determining protein MreB
MLIGERTSESLKLQIGSAYPLQEEVSCEVKGRDLVNGLPRSVRINSADLREAIKDPILEIVETVKTTLEQSPPELSADIMERALCWQAAAPFCADSTSCWRTKPVYPFTLLPIR